ncbi:MAG: hypothetical protein HC802_17495 [Caldilineaceae bacterium]|nr:hypothetical protein [Caldilineaceae bacterium]
MASAWRSMVSADRWKLNLCRADRCELYDLNQDPHEMINRFDDPDQSDRVVEMTGIIRRWQERVADGVVLPAVGE